MSDEDKHVNLRAEERVAYVRRLGELRAEGVAEIERRRAEIERDRRGADAERRRRQCGACNWPLDGQCRSCPLKTGSLSENGHDTPRRGSPPERRQTG
jgi:hypothetical protein